MKISRWNAPIILKFLQFVLLGLFVLLNIFNIQAGWADNGDFSRATRWFSSGPAFTAEYYPQPGTPEWDLLYHNYFFPYRILDYPFSSQLFISAYLLWLPGILLNHFFYSSSVLWVPFASLGARAALFGMLWALLAWLRGRSAHPWLHFITLGYPLILVYATTDVAAYYNSFYQETGTLVFLPLLLSVVVWGRSRRRDRWFFLAYLAAVLLLVTSKTACFYWPILALPFSLPFDRIKQNLRVGLPLAAALALIPMACGLILTDVPTTGPARPYNALFGGVLRFSEAPEQRLAELGLGRTLKCLDVDWFSSGGSDCARDDWERINYQAVVQVILSEPAIFLRQSEFLLNSMQNFSLSLGKYAVEDQVTRKGGRLNWWSEFQQSVFPRGGWLVGASLLLSLGIAWTWRKDGLAGDLARVGLICLLAMWIDMYVEILGDGQRDLLKHLLTANILFDLSLLSVLNAVIATGLGRLKRLPMLT